MGDGGVQIGDNFNRQYIIQIFGFPVDFGGGFDRDNRLGGGVPFKMNIFGIKGRL